MYSACRSVPIIIIVSLLRQTYETALRSLIRAAWCWIDSHDLRVLMPISFKSCTTLLSRNQQSPAFAWKIQPNQLFIQILMGPHCFPYAWNCISHSWAHFFTCDPQSPSKTVETAFRLIPSAFPDKMTILPWFCLIRPALMLLSRSGQFCNCQGPDD